MTDFPVSEWISTSVPSTVLAAQAAAKLVPDPYYGMNLRNIPGTAIRSAMTSRIFPCRMTVPIAAAGGIALNFAAPAASVHESVLAPFWGHQLSRRSVAEREAHRRSSTVAGAYRVYDFDVTDVLKPGAKTCWRWKHSRPREKDLGINWVDWNPCPPDKDMGLWGEVNLVTTGAVTVRSPMVVTHFPDASLATADLTVYAELHNAAAHEMRGVVSGSAAGIRFEQPVQLAAHEDQTVVFTPEQFPVLRLKNPKPWWPYQMGDPHLEHLDIGFAAQGVKMDEQSVDFGIREITSELTSNGSRLFRVNGKPILIRGGGWSQDMLLRTDEQRLRDQIHMVRDMNLNTIRLEGKLETEDFFRLADQQGILVMLGWCCCDHWEHWKDWTAKT